MRGLDTLPQIQNSQEPPRTQDTPKPFVSFGRDGRRPHVKSNIRAKHANSGNGSGRKKFFSKFGSQDKQQRRKKAGRKVALDSRDRQEIRFVSPAETPAPAVVREPEVRPDGRAPRVKANQRNSGFSREQEQEEQSTLSPFVEQFFASPSSPKPFIFTVSCATLQCASLYCIVLHCTSIFFTVLHCVSLCYAVHCTLVHCTALHTSLK